MKNIKVADCCLHKAKKITGLIFGRSALFCAHCKYGDTKLHSKADQGGDEESTQAYGL